jgi:hypothetical protein
MVAIAQTPQGIDWLRWLDEDLWDERMRSFSRRKLEPDEIDRIFALAREHNLALHMINTNFGFSIGFVVAEGGPYPGTPAKRILTVGADALRERGGHDTFDPLWDLLSPHTHNAENRERLLACGLPEPKQKGHYVY